MADLARLRLIPNVGLLGESLFALAMIGQPSEAHSAWRKQALADVRRASADVDRIVRAVRPIPDLLWLLSSDPERLSNGMSGERRELGKMVRKFGQITVAPYWERGGAYLAVKSDALSRLVATRGAGMLLSVLHARINWNPPVLEILNDEQRDVELAGRGLVLAPSLFLPRKTPLLIESDEPMLIFPTSGDIGDDPELWERQNPGGKALAGLVGRTRAAALRALATSHTTGELAENLGVSLASVSHHTSVLRDAGLITSRRHRNTVLHDVTPLGSLVLRGTCTVGEAPLLLLADKAERA